MQNPRLKMSSSAARGITMVIALGLAIVLALLLARARTRYREAELERARLTEELARLKLQNEALRGRLEAHGVENAKAERPAGDAAAPWICDRAPCNPGDRSPHSETTKPRLIRDIPTSRPGQL